MRIVIVTGMSGAGKRTALKVLEDAGYYCVDNLPIELVIKFIDLIMNSNKKVKNIAMGVDVRVGDSFVDIEDVLAQMEKKNYWYEILFLEATDDVLVKRYKETRRNHPLAGDHRIMEGIELEREEIAFLKKKADYIIDTSTLLARELRQEMVKIFVEDEKFKNMMITLLTFGFKNGIPEDADLVFDVRFLPNPYYIAELKPLTGNDKKIMDYVMGFDISKVFVEKLVDMIEFLIPNYILEGRNHLVIAIGCTGGKHRSVTVANVLYDILKDGEFGINLDHRDIDIDSKKNE